jgi:uncharacterized protein (DUF433 family)
MSTTNPVLSVRLPHETAEKVRRLAKSENRSVAETMRILTDEALKQREFPGVYFMDGPTGRRARLRGGPDVWEIIEPYVYAGRDWDVLGETYHWLDESILKTALAYYAAYPDEIDERIERNRPR